MLKYRIKIYIYNYDNDKTWNHLSILCRYKTVPDDLFEVRRCELAESGISTRLYDFFDADAASGTALTALTQLSLRLVGNTEEEEDLSKVAKEIASNMQLYNTNVGKIRQSVRTTIKDVFCCYGHVAA